MIKRVVKLSFVPENIAIFLRVFEEAKEQIRAFPGCQHLELWRAKSPDHIFFTYSYWDSEADLDHYRHSDLFRRTWAKTKPLFSERAEAWSVDVLAELP